MFGGDPVPCPPTRPDTGLPDELRDALAAAGRAQGTLGPDWVGQTDAFASKPRDPEWAYAELACELVDPTAKPFSPPRYSWYELAPADWGTLVRLDDRARGTVSGDYVQFISGGAGSGTVPCAVQTGSGSGSGTTDPAPGVQCLVRAAPGGWWAAVNGATWGTLAPAGEEGEYYEFPAITGLSLPYRELTVFTDSGGTLTDPGTPGSTPATLYVFTATPRASYRTIRVRPEQLPGGSGSAACGPTNECCLFATGDPVESPCCPGRPLPRTLYLRFASTNPCLDGVTLPLTYYPPAGFWDVGGTLFGDEVTLGSCGRFRFKLYCDQPYGHTWALAIDYAPSPLVPCYFYSSETGAPPGPPPSGTALFALSVPCGDPFSIVFDPNLYGTPMWFGGLFDCPYPPARVTLTISES